MIRQNRCKIFTMMISILLVCTFCFSAVAEETGVRIDENHFPDDAFRAVVLQYDSNEDLMLSKEEVQLVKDMNLWDKNVQNLQGIEYFTELEKLECGYNRLRDLDVSRNTKLRELRCDDNWLTYLYLNNNTELRILQCGNNKLKTLNLNDNSKLTNLYCAENCLTELDVSNNPDLEELNFVWNDVGAIDVSNNPKLKELAVSGNPVGKLDLSILPELEQLFCPWSEITELDLSANPKLYYLSCIGNQLTELDLSHDPEISHLLTDDNRLETLDISNCPKLVSLVEKEEAKPGCYETSLEWIGVSNSFRSGDLSIDKNVKLYTGTEKNTETQNPENKTAETTNAVNESTVDYSSAFPIRMDSYDKELLLNFFCNWSQHNVNELPMSFSSAQRTSEEHVQELMDELFDLGTPVSFQINSCNGGYGDMTYVCTVEMAHEEGEPVRFVQIEISAGDWKVRGFDIEGMKTVEPAEYDPSKQVFSLDPDAAIQHMLAISRQTEEIEGELQPIGVSSEDAGIRLEVISGLVRGDSAWFFISLEDLEGKYDDCKLEPIYIDNDIGELAWYSHSKLYHDIKAHKAYYLYRIHFEESVNTNERDLSLSVHSIAGLHNGWMDLSELLVKYSGEAENVAEAPSQVYHGDYEHSDRELTDEEKKVLDYYNPLDIKAQPNTTITGIGWIDGKLHVQVQASWDAEILDKGVSIYNNDAKPVYSPLYWYSGYKGTTEYILNYKPEEASRLKLVLQSVDRQEEVSGTWRIRFPLSQVCPDTKKEAAESTEQAAPETSQDNTGVTVAKETQYVSSYPDTMNDYKQYNIWEFFCNWAQGDIDSLPYSFTREQRAGGEETQTKIKELLNRKPLSYKIENKETADVNNALTYYIAVELDTGKENASRIERMSFNMVSENNWDYRIDLDSIKFLGSPETVPTEGVISLSKDAIINDQLDYFFEHIREKLQPVGETHECNGIRLEVISGYVEGREAWYLYSLEDLEGKYESFAPDIWDMEDGLGTMESYQPGILYHDKAEKKSYHMFHLTHTEAIGTDERDVTLRLSNIHFNKNGWADLMPILKEHMEPVEGVHPTADLWDSDWEHMDKELNPEDYKVLDYHNPLDIEVIPGAFVTGIGWIDDQLHVQVRMADGLAGYSEWVDTSLNGEYVFDREVPNTPLNWVAGDKFYKEYIFNYTPADADRLNVIMSTSSAHESLDGVWVVRFPLSKICPNVKVETPEAEPVEETTEETAEVAEEPTLTLELKDGVYVLTQDGISYRLNEDGTATIVKIGKAPGEPIEIPETVVLTFAVNDVDYGAFLEYVNGK